MPGYNGFKCHYLCPDTTRFKCHYAWGLCARNIGQPYLVWRHTAFTGFGVFYVRYSLAGLGSLDPIITSTSRDKKTHVTTCHSSERILGREVEAVSSMQYIQSSKHRAVYMDKGGLDLR